MSLHQEVWIPLNRPIQSQSFHWQRWIERPKSPLNGYLREVSLSISTQQRCNQESCFPLLQAMESRIILKLHCLCPPMIHGTALRGPTLRHFIRYSITVMVSFLKEH